MKNKYSQILKVAVLLENAGIPFKIENMFTGYKITIVGSGKRILCDAIQHDYSMGLEIMGGLTYKEEEREDCNVLGYLESEDVFNRFKFCYEHNTSHYDPVSFKQYLLSLSENDFKDWWKANASSFNSLREFLDLLDKEHK